MHISEKKKAELQNSLLTWKECLNGSHTGANSVGRVFWVCCDCIEIKGLAIIVSNLSVSFDPCRKSLQLNDIYMLFLTACGIG